MPHRRYQYDPNPRVREAMGAIWRALVPEPRVAVEAHWDAIAAELLGELGSRLWRNREAAALGLADLLQARAVFWGFTALIGLPVRLHLSGAQLCCSGLQLALSCMAGL